MLLNYCKQKANEFQNKQKSTCTTVPSKIRKMEQIENMSRLEKQIIYDLYEYCTIIMGECLKEEDITR